LRSLRARSALPRIVENGAQWLAILQKPDSMTAQPQASTA
jgi:hypothetical protein